MARDFQKGSNFKYGIYVDINGDGGLGDEKFIPGSRFDIGQSGLTAASFPQILFTAPAPCKLIRAIGRHATVAGQAGTAQLEKVPSGTAPGSGTNLLANAFDLTATINTNQVENALPTLSTISLATGDSIGIKVASGAATSYAGGTITVVLEWT